MGGERLTAEERAAITGPGGTNDWLKALAAVEAILAARLAPIEALSGLDEFHAKVRAILVDRAALDEQIEEFFEEVLDDIDAVARDLLAVRLVARAEALADEWQAELDEGRIRDETARYCWSTAARELRAALAAQPTTTEAS